MLPVSQPDVARTLRDHATRKKWPLWRRVLLWGHGSQDRIFSGGRAHRPPTVPDPAVGLFGPRSAAMTPESRSAYPGEKLGLPESGPGSLARMGRRLGALTIDWLIALGLAALAMRLGWLPEGALATAELVVWFVLGVVSVRLFGFTPGQLALGLQVVTVDGRGLVGTGRAVVRGLLVGTVVPALFTDWDGRGLQDRLTATAVVRR